MTKAAPAVFLDRDDTVIEDPGYLRDCSHVRLLPGAAEAIRLFRQAGFKVVVVTNQSGVARGYFTESQLAAIHDHLRQVLAAQAALLDGIYYCPYHPEGVVEAYRKDSDWRKPGCGMLVAAASDLGLDLCSSWMIGDSPRDVEAGRRAGCRTVLLTAADEDLSSARSLTSADGAAMALGGGAAASGVAAVAAGQANLAAGSLLEASRRILEICNKSLTRMESHGN